MQLSLPKMKKHGWGGKRKGAGRPRTGPRACVSHHARPFHESGHPVLVTERFQRDLPMMRDPVLGKVIAAAIRVSKTRTFQVIHFSIQGDHLHMIVEAGSKASLSRGIQGLKIRIARRINRALGRTGKVWTDRYHAKALASPRQVRFGIRYVLSNWLKHVEGARGLDPFSSARWFQGWTTRPPAQATRSPVAPARTWLAGKGWKRHGLIGPSERPGKRAEVV